MKRGLIEITGMLMFLVGMSFIFNSFSEITGQVIIENFEGRNNSILGIILITLGIFMNITGRVYRTNINKKINPKEGIKKIKFALFQITKGYKKLIKLAKGAGYKVIETSEHITIFSPKTDEVLKDSEGFPIKLNPKKRLKFKEYRTTLKSILKDYKN